MRRMLQSTLALVFFLLSNRRKIPGINFTSTSHLPKWPKTGKRKLYLAPLLVLGCLLGSSYMLSAQCPMNEADLADGGDFSGTCVINVGGSITITGVVNWNGGTLRITGNQGHLNLVGTLNVNQGSVIIDDDGGGGDLEVKGGGVLNVSNLGSFTTEGGNIVVEDGGTATIDGIISSGNDINIEMGASMTVNGFLFSDDDVTVNGSLEINGTVNVGDDMNISDASAVVNVNNGGKIVTGYGGVGLGNLNVNNGASLTVDAGGELDIDNDLAVDDSGTTVVMDGIMTVGDDITVYVFSTLTGTGILIDIGGDIDADTPWANCTTFPCASALPINLVNFRADVQQESKVLLSWETAGEQNNAYMAVERAGANLQFDEIGRIDGQGTVSSRQFYEFLDENPLPGFNYYRLRQVDFDGAMEYHSVISVQLDGPATFAVKAFPNPATEEIRVQWTLGADNTTYQKENHLRLFNANGRQIAQYRLSGNSGVQYIPLRDLPAGIYAMQLVQGNKVETVRIVKQ